MIYINVPLGLGDEIHKHHNCIVLADTSKSDCSERFMHA